MFSPPAQLTHKWPESSESKLIKYFDLSSNLHLEAPIKPISSYDVNKISNGPCLAFSSSRTVIQAARAKPSSAPRLESWDE